MEQKITTERGYCNGSSAMETRTHFKNRVSPKNDRSRKKFLIMLSAFLLLTTQSVFAQNSYHYGLWYDFQTVLVDGKNTDCAIVTDLPEHSPAQKAGLRANDVIIAINGKPANKENFEGMTSQSQITLLVKRFGNQNVTLNISGVPCLSRSMIPESDYGFLDVAGKRQYDVCLSRKSIEPIVIMSDHDADFFQYKSFDFEFTGENTMQQKEIAPELEKILTDRGLTRDRENPDILVFIDVYSDRREQYVPPSQQISTRYGTRYNYYTGQRETRQYIESYQTGNYTKVDYFSKLSVSMADAKKLSSGESAKAMIWQADYEVLYKKKANLKDFANNIGYEMLAAFPFRLDVFSVFSYYYTGIIYDEGVAGIVSGVVPGSPAEKAGIKAGDIIKYSSWGKNQIIFAKSYSKLIEKRKPMYYHTDADYELTRVVDLHFGNYISPFQSTYMSVFMKKNKYPYYESEISHGSKPLIFTVKSADGKTKKVEINPIKTRGQRFVY